MRFSALLIPLLAFATLATTPSCASKPGPEPQKSAEEAGARPVSETEDPPTESETGPVEVSESSDGENEETLAEAPVWSFVTVATGGVHGNEPSGAHVLPDLTEMGFVTFGPCNPWGLENNKRELEDGRDLNRSFSLDDCEEAKKVREFLEQNPPDLLLDLHEDPGGAHPYLIQNDPESDLARRVVEALADEYEFAPEPSWSIIKGKDGVIQPTTQMLWWQEKSKVWSLAFYAWHTHECTAITVEVPGSWPMEKKAAYQIRVCETARRIFHEMKAEEKAAAEEGKTEESK